MTNQDILQIALQQSAYDCNCAPEDFLSQQNLVTRSRKHALARKYLPLPFACDMVSYGNNIVAQTSEELAGPVAAYLQKGPPFRCLEPPYLHVLDDALEEFGLQVCFMAEYFLPDLHCLRRCPVTEPFAFCTRPTLPTCTGNPRAMPCANHGGNWTSWALALMQTAG